jgi:pimeloyl-ACP methyl ester carboxylesterase
MDTYAADVAEVVKALDLKNAIHIGHSTGGGEVTRHVARHGKGKGRQACAHQLHSPDAVEVGQESRRSSDGGV